MPVIRRLPSSRTRTSKPCAPPWSVCPGVLDHVDSLIADGTIGGEAPNAADFQILSSVRVLLEFEDLSGRLEAGPAPQRPGSCFPDWAGAIARGLPAVS